MDIENLRRKNKALLVDQVFALCRLADDTEKKSQWIDYLMDGGEVEKMLVFLQEFQADVSGQNHAA